MKSFEPAKSISLLQAVEDYLQNGRSLGLLSEKTISTRGFELARFAGYCDSKGIHHPHELYKSLAVNYLGSLKVANGTQATILAVLSSFVTYLVDEYLCPENFLVSIKRPKAYVPEADFLVSEEINDFFRSVAENSRDELVDRNLLLASLLTVLCLRVSEAVNLKLEDVKVGSSCIWVHRKGGKIEKIPLNDDLKIKFEIWIEQRAKWPGAELPWVFLSLKGVQMSVRSAQKMVAKGLRKANIFKRKAGPHLRHSGASYYLANGTDIKTVQILLAHESLATTSKYVHSTAKALEKAINGFKRID